MIRRGLLAVVLIFIVWSALDFILHGVLLTDAYEATANLWRPMEEMKMTTMYATTLVFVICFVAIYGYLITPKSFRSGVLYGALFGLAIGVSMGFGSYSYMPITLTLAWSWFLGSLVEATVAGAIIGAVVKP